MMRFRCPFCYVAVKADRDSCGYTMVCPNCARQVSVPPGRFAPGSIVGDFLIKKKLGSGNSGCVYLATQLSLERQVALKILSPEYTAKHGIESFLREARSAAKLNHINLVRSFAVGQEDSFFYMAMTFINGESIKERLDRSGPIGVDESLHIIQQVAEALSYAWENSGLIHRDIKPENIMVNLEGIVKLTDLGLSIFAGEGKEADGVAGSPAYMSPEQLSGKLLDSRSDIYSLGITLFQMMAGKLPYDGNNIRSVADQHYSSPIPHLHKINKEIPRNVSDFVARAMAKDPANRFADMEHFLKEIWTLRQSTAPDRTLIPEIHTLSSAHLDYESHLEQAKAKRNVRKLEKEVRQSKRYMKLLFPLLPILVGAAISMTIYRYESLKPVEKSMERIALDRLNAFERFAKDPAIPAYHVRLEGNKILSEFRLVNVYLRTNIRNHVRKVVAERELKESREMIRKLRKNLSGQEALLEKHALFLLFHQHALKKDSSALARSVTSGKKLYPHLAGWIDNRKKICERLILFLTLPRKEIPKKFSRLDQRYFKALSEGKFGLSMALHPADKEMRLFLQLHRRYALLYLIRLRREKGREEAAKEMAKLLPAFEGSRDYKKIRSDFDKVLLLPEKLSGDKGTGL